MIRLNDNFDRMSKNYLFSEIAARVRAYSESNPDKRIIRMGIGDVSLPLPATVTDSVHKAIDEMSKKETFRGYAPEYGYDFIREAVSKRYMSFGANVPKEDIFVGDGAKSDLGNILDIFGDNTALIPDPVYPVYLDSNIMNGHKVKFLAANESNHFLPMPDFDDNNSYVIYLCSPNNPTGAVYNREQLKNWVDYALKTESVIIFDSAYEAFIKGDYPHSIYEIDGSKKCSVEICSLSKTAGFTGMRCGWTIVPHELIIGGTKLSDLWMRRQATKFNGVPYVIQRAAEAALSEKGIAECMENIRYYMENADIIASVLDRKGIEYVGGKNSPYIWLKCPKGMKSWDFFDYLLNKYQIVGTPGSGFGKEGEGYFRLTSFGSREATLEAASRIE